MKNTLAIILISAAGIGFTASASGATPEAKAAYKTAKDTADNDYKAAHEKCKSLSGNAKDVCVEEANLNRTRAKSEAEAVYKDTVRARTSARIDVADAEYKLAKAKCGSLGGNDKDVCIKEAKAAHTTAKADAKADKAVANARNDARDDKRDANYKLALEKCDSLAGAAKDSCTSAAKSQYGK